MGTKQLLAEQIQLQEDAIHAIKGSINSEKSRATVDTHALNYFLGRLSQEEKRLIRLERKYE